MKPEPAIPDFQWYSAESRRLELAPRCPFAAVHGCPRYYQSLSLLGRAGNTAIPKEENMPANNRAFWSKKLNGNKVHDRLVTRALRQRGWRVLRIWEHDLARKNQGRCVERIRLLLAG